MMPYNIYFDECGIQEVRKEEYNDEIDPQILVIQRNEKLIGFVSLCLA